MKESVLKLLRQRLEIVEHYINKYNESLEVGLKLQKSSLFINGIEVLEERLTEFKQQRVEIENCIKWIETL